MTGCFDSIFKAQCWIHMTSLKLTTTSFWIHCGIFISENILFLSTNLDLKHAKPSVSKIFNAYIILLAKYLILNWNIVKKFIFYQKRLILDNNFQNFIGFRGMLCARFNPILHHFTIWCTFGQLIVFLFLDLCTSEYWPILWTRFDFLKWIDITLRRYRLFIIASDKSQFIFVCIKHCFTLNTSVVTPVRAGLNFKWSKIWL